MLKASRNDGIEVAVQHAGGGKANQYFLRGFDADHGTDVAFFVDGVPVNMPSHGHGQGFADFHFLIPELVTTATVKSFSKLINGPFSAANAGVFAKISKYFNITYSNTNQLPIPAGL